MRSLPAKRDFAKRIRGRLTYANVMSSIAVFLALGGATALAAAQLEKNSVGVKQLKNNSVTSPKVKDGSLKAADFAVGQLPAATKGATGATGIRGPKGSPGFGVLQSVAGETASNSESRKILVVECPAGKKVVGSGFDINGALSGESPNEIKEATIDGVFASEDGGSMTFEAFEQKGGTVASWSIEGRISCATVE